MSGLRGKFAEGDRVEQVRRIGAGIEKRREGIVRKVGAKGVEVRFMDDGEIGWRHAHDLHIVEPGPNHAEPRERHLAVVDAAPVEEPAEVVPAAATTPAPAPASAGDVLARLESQGVDVVAFWRALGAGLSERTRRAVMEAEEAQERAEADVREAEALLADARRTLASAKARAEDARRELAVVEREMGVLR